MDTVRLAVEAAWKVLYVGLLLGARPARLERGEEALAVHVQPPDPERRSGRGETPDPRRRPRVARTVARGGRRRRRRRRVAASPVRMADSARWK